MKVTVGWVCVIASLLAIGCSPSRPSATDDDDDAGSGGSDGIDANGNGNGDGNGGSDNCGSGAEYVYTIDELTNQLSRFDPATKTFSDLGVLACDQVVLGSTPFSMSVDRNTIAWVLFQSGELFHVDINHSLACTPTTWASPDGLRVFGMGFSTDTVGGSTDSLFVGGGADEVTPSYSFAKLNTTAMTAQIVGSEPALPEMTGNSNAELWGFYQESSTAHVVQFNKADGTLLTDFDEPSLGGTMNGYAFAHWGGDFWVFLSVKGATTVYQVDHTSGAITSTTHANGRTVVGAGVSTCAPVVVQ